jgi:hypothetical protein
MKRESGVNPEQFPLLYALFVCLLFFATIPHVRDGKAVNKE